MDRYRPDITKILGTEKWKLIEGQYSPPCGKCKNSTGGNYYLDIVDDKGITQIRAAQFTLIQMVNCCGIMVSTVARVDEEYRHRGLGTLLNKLRMDIARDLGYTILLCTDIIKNEYQRKILAKNKWEDIFKFVNKKTNNEIAISVIKL